MSGEIVFGAIPEDLRLNRKGQISGKQRRRLWGQFLMTLIGGILLIAAPVMLAWMLILWSTGAFQIFEQGALIGYLIGILLGVIYISVNYQTFLLAIDLLIGKVESVVAPARVWGKYLIIGKYRFVVEEEQLTLVKTGIGYRAFLLPLSHTLLSIEFSE